MSDDFLRLIPQDPNYVPGEDSQAEAAEAVRSMFPAADSVKATTTERVEFVDQGENFEALRCPACHAELSMEWWHESMNGAYNSGFSSLAIRTPCCSTVTSLNDLEYDWAAGFSRFVLEVMNPGRDLDPSDLVNLQTILGCGLRVVRAYY